MNFINEPNRIILYGKSHEVLAEVAYTDVNDRLVDINHTFVSDSLRGQGIAGKLMKALVQRLQDENKRAIASCSYAVSWFAKHKEYNITEEFFE